MRPYLRWITSLLILSLPVIWPVIRPGSRGESGPLAQSASPTLAGRIGEVINTDEYRLSTWGMAVADASTGEMIYALNPDQLFVPGSVTKLFSGAAALATFGPDHRFVTPLHRRGEVDSAGILRGDLILRATGDPDLSGRTPTTITPTLTSMFRRGAVPS
ncbi:MAG: hypothetical protein EBZ36_03205 [Acidobacteria bacterium]|nr:hypothetical protein [Acidobacteriota bacterium]